MINFASPGTSEISPYCCVTAAFSLAADETRHGWRRPPKTLRRTAYILRRWVTLTSQCGQWKWLPKALGKLPVALQTLNGDRACRSVAYRRCHHSRLVVCGTFTSKCLEEHNFAAVLAFRRVLLPYLFSCTRLSHTALVVYEWWPVWPIRAQLSDWNVLEVDLGKET